MSKYLRKLQTLATVDKRWLLRYLTKYGKQNLSFALAKLRGKSYWEIHERSLCIKLGFFTPYHQAIAQDIRHGNYERHVMDAWIQALPDKKIIYDIGGFNGLYGLLAAKNNPDAQVTIFEPDHTNAEHIRQNIRLNELKNCIAVEAAVSDTSGTTTFSQGGTSGEHIGATGTEVRVIALKDMPKADLIKIDVEGAELKVLMGMGYTTTALLEVHPLFVSRFSDTEEDIAAFLKQEEYTVKFLEERDKAKHYFLQPSS